MSFEKRYINNTLCIWSLTKAPDGLHGNGGASCEELKRQYSRIRVLREENNQLLKKEVLPYLDGTLALDDAHAEALEHFSKSLSRLNDQSFVDHLLCLKIHTCLLARAREQKNKAAELENTLEIILFDYHITTLANRDYSSQHTPLYLRYNDDALARELELLPLLEPDRFRRLSPKEQGLLLKISRYEWLFYPGGDDPEAFAKKADAALRALAVAESDLYHEMAPHHDWETQITACRYYVSLLVEYLPHANADMRLMRAIAAVAERQLDDLVSGKPNAYISLAAAEVLVNALHLRMGMLTADEYILGIQSRYELRNPHDYSYEGVEQNMRLAASLHDAVLDHGQGKPEYLALLRQIYHNLAHYALNLPTGDQRELFVNYLAGILYRFHEDENSDITLAQMCSTLLANCQPATYIHSQMVGQLSRALGMRMLHRDPSRFIGVCGCQNEQQVLLRQQRIAHFLYECGLYHDLGKIPYLDVFGIDYRCLFTEEFDFIREHPMAGYQLLSRCPSTAPYAGLALGHHVWYNAKDGYPAEYDRSSGQPALLVDIVCVADCMDAATDSDFRSYSQGKSLNAFIDEVLQGSGTRYAPYIAELFNDSDIRDELSDLLTRGRDEAYLCAFDLYRSQFAAYGSCAPAEKNAVLPPVDYAQFDALLHDLHQSEEPVDALRQLVLNHLTDERVSGEYIDRFNAIAAGHGYLYAQAVGAAMLFWRTYSIDLDAALRYNDKGLALIRNVPDYSQTKGYHSLLNNAVLGQTMRKDYAAAYKYALEGLQLVSKDPDSLPFYCALLNNTSVILSDVGLFDKALEHIEESLSNISVLSPTSAVATRFRYAEILMDTGAYERSQAVYLELLSTCASYGIERWQLLPRLVVLSYRRQDGIGIDYWYSELEKELDNVPAINADMHLITQARALYHAWHGNYQEADRNFELLVAAREEVLMSESAILRDAAVFYDSFEHTEKAHPLYVRLDEFHQRFIKLVEQIMIVENSARKQEISNLAYNILLRRMRQTSTLTRRLIAAGSPEMLYHTLLDGLPDLLPTDAMALLLRAKTPHALNVLGAVRTEPITMNHPLLQRFAASTLPVVTDQAALASDLLPNGPISGGTLAYVPLRLEGGMPEALLVYNATPAAYDLGSREILASLASGVTVALDAIDRYNNALRKAHHDPLTGILNRAGIFANAAELFASIPAYLCLIDIDDFKRINDQFGHHAGDSVLISLGELLTSLTPDGVAGRYGGEEFVVITPADESGMSRFAERIRKACVTHRLFAQQEHPITVSIGVVSLSPGESLNNAIDRADVLMYQAKRDGKNRVCR